MHNKAYGDSFESSSLKQMKSRIFLPRQSFRASHSITSHIHRGNYCRGPDSASLSAACRQRATTIRMPVEAVVPAITRHHRIPYSGRIASAGISGGQKPLLGPDRRRAHDACVTRKAWNWPRLDIKEGSFSKISCFPAPDPSLRVGGPKDELVTRFASIVVQRNVAFLLVLYEASCFSDRRFR